MLAAETAVEVAADGGVASVSGKLANTIDVVAKTLERDFGLGFATHVVGHDHPNVESMSDDAAAGDDRFRLGIRKLPLVRYERAVVMMAGKQSAAEEVHRLIETLVGEVGNVENHADALHLLQQFTALREESALGARAMAIRTDAIEAGANDAQAGVPPFLNLIGAEDGVGAFHAEDEAKRQRRRVFVDLPGVDVRFERWPILDEAEDTLLLQTAVIVKLPHGCTERRRGLRIILDRRNAAGPKEPGEHRGNEGDDLTSAKIGERNGVPAATFFGLAGRDFELPNLLARKLQVAVPIERVPGKVEMSIKDEYGVNLLFILR